MNTTKEMIVKKRYKLVDLSQTMRDKILKLLDDIYTLKKSEPIEELKKLSKIKKSKKWWRYHIFVQFQRVDKYRIKNGLKPIHFEDNEHK